jgi:hypothetical protein
MELPRPKITALILLLGLGGYFLFFPFGFPLGFIRLSFSRPIGALPTPLGWEVMSRGSSGSTYGNVAIDDFVDVESYYVGRGVIVRNIYINPGRRADGQERVKMDRETRRKFEKSLWAIKQSWFPLLGNKLELNTAAPKDAFFYDRRELFFSNGRLLSVVSRASLKGGDSIDTTGSEDLDFVLETLEGYQ